MGSGTNLGLSFKKKKKEILEVPWISMHFMEHIIEWIWRCFKISEMPCRCNSWLPTQTYTHKHPQNCGLLVVLAERCYSWELFYLFISPYFFWVNFGNLLFFRECVASAITAPSQGWGLMLFSRHQVKDVRETRVKGKCLFPGGTLVTLWLNVIMPLKDQLMQRRQGRFPPAVKRETLTSAFSCGWEKSVEVGIVSLSCRRFAESPPISEPQFPHLQNNWLVRSPGSPRNIVKTLQ